MPAHRNRVYESTKKWRDTRSNRPNVATGSALASAAGGQTQATTEAVKPDSSILPAPPSPQAVAEAKKQFKAGLKLKSSGKMDAAFANFEQASQLDPRNVEYATAREFARQELVMAALDRGNKAMQAKNEVAATAEFRQALRYDPSNEFARQLNDSVWDSNVKPSRCFK